MAKKGSSKSYRYYQSNLYRKYKDFNKDIYKRHYGNEIKAMRRQQLDLMNKLKKYRREGNKQWATRTENRLRTMDRIYRDKQLENEKIIKIGNKLRVKSIDINSIDFDLRKLSYAGVINDILGAHLDGFLLNGTTGSINLTKRLEQLESMGEFKDKQEMIMYLDLARGYGLSTKKNI